MTVVTLEHQKRWADSVVFEQALLLESLFLIFYDSLLCDERHVRQIMQLVQVKNIKKTNF